jgi:hypothetical protein
LLWGIWLLLLLKCRLLLTVFGFLSDLLNLQATHRYYCINYKYYSCCRFGYREKEGFFNVRPCNNLFSFRGLFVHYLQNLKRSFIIIISQTFVEIKTSYMRNYKCLIVLKHTTLVVLQLLWKTYIIYFQSFLLLKRNQIIMTLYSWRDLRNIVLVIFV